MLICSYALYIALQSTRSSTNAYFILDRRFYSTTTQWASAVLSSIDSSFKAVWNIEHTLLQHSTDININAADELCLGSNFNPIETFENTSTNPYNCAFSNNGPHGVINVTAKYGGLENGITVDCIALYCMGLFCIAADFYRLICSALFLTYYDVISLTRLHRQRRRSSHILTSLARIHHTRMIEHGRAFVSFSLF